MSVPMSSDGNTELKKTNLLTWMFPMLDNDTFGHKTALQLNLNHSFFPYRTALVCWRWPTLCLTDSTVIDKLPPAGNLSTADNPSWGQVGFKDSIGEPSHCQSKTTTTSSHPVVEHQTSTVYRALSKLSQSLPPWGPKCYGPSKAHILRISIYVSFFTLLNVTRHKRN